MPDMRSDVAYRNLRRFTNNSPDGLLQLLVAAAGRSTLQRIIGCPTYPVPVKTAGLTDAVRTLKELLTSQQVHLPTFLARLYTPTRTLEFRKRTGQFFTSELVSEWALSRARPSATDDVCDAGSGTAVFANAVLRMGIPIHSYVGIENDPLLALCAAHVLEALQAPKCYRIWYANFLLLDELAFNSKGLATPTFVIANPPFVRYHNLKGRARIREALKSKLGLTISSLSGSSGYFLSRAAQLARQNNSSSKSTHHHRLLFFLPRESSGAAHAQRLREDLQRSHGWTYREYEIPHDQTGIDRHRSNALALLFVFEQDKIRHPPSSIEINVGGPAVRDVLKIARGISTGCNDFFVLTDEQVQHRRIDQKWLTKVLPTRIHIPGINFTEETWDLLRKSGRPCWLLTLPDVDIQDFDKPVRNYLREGLRKGVHLTPTAKAMSSWFSLRIPPEHPNMFITYFFRGAPRFILNEAPVYHLTNILGGRFIAKVNDARCRQTITDLLNEQALFWMNDKTVGREYMGGLRKIEPRELSMLPIGERIVAAFDPIKQMTKVAVNRSLFD
jgi:hypothetical protein